MTARFYAIFPSIYAGFTKIKMAEASGSRTHRRQENLPPAGFEDHQECSDWL